MGPWIVDDHLTDLKKMAGMNVENRAVARALIGRGGGVYSYIRVMPDRFQF